MGRSARRASIGAGNAVSLRVACLALVVLCQEVAPASAIAARSLGLPADRAVMAPDTQGGFAVESGETLPGGAVAFGLRLGTLGPPWSLKNELTGETVAVPVQWAVTLEAVAAIAPVRRFQVGLALPVTVRQAGDRLRGVEDEAPLAATAGGDVRLHLKASLFEASCGGGRLALAFAPYLALPSGDASQFAGVGSLWGEVRLAGALRWSRGAAFANLGVRLRRPVRFFGLRYDTAAPTFGIGSAVTPARRGFLGRFAFVAEIEGESQAWGRPVPVEGRLGVRVRVWRWLAASAGGGTSLSREPGAPAWRALVALDLVQPD